MTSLNIGKPYRVEIKDPAGNLFSKSINKWENVDLGDERDFVKLTQTIDFAYDGGQRSSRDWHDVRV